MILKNSKSISKIVLVNDSQTQQAMIRDMLIDFNVKVAENEKQLNKILADWQPDLIIVNNVLMESNGYTISAHIRSKSDYDDMAIILTASEDHPVDMERAYEVGCNSYLTKPFSQDKLLHSIDNLTPQQQEYFESKSDHPRILIVDDSKAIRTMIATQFTKKGYIVKQAEDGKQGLEALKKFTPDLITVDIEMPEMDGLTFCSHVRDSSNGSEVPIVIISSDDTYETRVKGYDVGVIEFFRKPFQSEKIFFYVDNLIASLKVSNDFKVLVVEDARLEQHIMKYALMRGGYKPYVVSSGEEALEITKAISFDIILLDIILKKTDGFAVCRQLREHVDTKEIPIIVVTGLRDSISQSFDMGATDYIGKPFTVEDLMMRIKINLEKKQSFDKLDKTDWHYKAMEINVERQNKIVRFLIDSLDRLIIFLNSEARVLLVNKRLIELSGHSDSEIIQENWLNLFFPELSDRNHFITWLQEAMDGKNINNRDLTLTNADGQKHLIKWSILNMQNEVNESGGFLVIGIE